MLFVASFCYKTNQVSCVAFICQVFSFSFNSALSRLFLYDNDSFEESMPIVLLNELQILHL
jgi:hypothetical protein